jgi:uncharacterized membrane protein YccC
LKTALAVVIAYAVALYMDWDKPIWAGWTAASVSLDATGQSIQKGLNRIAGALVGSLAGFVLLGFFIQDRWLFFLFFSLWVAVCTYFSFGSERYNYFWQQAGFFAVVVGLDSAFSPANAFAIAIERTQEFGQGLAGQSGRCGLYRDRQAHTGISGRVLPALEEIAGIEVSSI